MLRHHVIPCIQFLGRNMESVFGDDCANGVGLRIGNASGFLISPSRL